MTSVRLCICKENEGGECKIGKIEQRENLFSTLKDLEDRLGKGLIKREKHEHCKGNWECDWTDDKVDVLHPHMYYIFTFNGSGNRAREHDKIFPEHKKKHSFPEICKTVIVFALFKTESDHEFVDIRKATGFGQFNLMIDVRSKVKQENRNPEKKAAIYFGFLYTDDGVFRNCRRVAVKQETNDSESHKAFTEIEKKIDALPRESNQIKGKMKSLIEEIEAAVRVERKTNDKRIKMIKQEVIAFIKADETGLQKELWSVNHTIQPILDDGKKCFDKKLKMIKNLPLSETLNVEEQLKQVNKTILEYKDDFTKLKEKIIEQFRNKQRILEGEINDLIQWMDESTQETEEITAKIKDIIEFSKVRKTIFEKKITYLTRKIDVLFQATEKTYKIGEEINFALEAGGKHNMKYLACTDTDSRDSKTIWIAMELCCMETLDVLIKKIDHDKLKICFTHILMGLAHLQSKGIRHGEIVMENILLSLDRKYLKIGDYDHVKHIVKDEEMHDDLMMTTSMFFQCLKSFNSKTKDDDGDGDNSETPDDHAAELNSWLSRLRGDLSNDEKNILSDVTKSLFSNIKLDAKRESTLREKLNKIGVAPDTWMLLLTNIETILHSVKCPEGFDRKGDFYLSAYLILHMAGDKPNFSEVKSPIFLE